MRTIFLHRKWPGRSFPVERLRLRTFAERTAVHLRRWVLAYVGLAAIALLCAAIAALAKRSEGGRSRNLQDGVRRGTR